ATMWHDARKQEKMIRRTLIDQSKRGEKRRRFFDAVRADPDQFMQIHGRPAVVHTEAAVARAAEDAAVLRPWQGDSKIMIDRFDARSHLDHIQKPKHRELPKDSPEAKMEILCDFERYRILIINEYRKVGEKEYLKKIAEAEYWHKSSASTQKTLKMQELEKKKKSAATKAAVGFSYDDSDVVKGRPDGEESDSESEEEDEGDMEDIDVDLDMSMISAESARKANLLGESYGVSRCSFVDLQMAETAWARNQAELKQIEREKLAISGKNGRRERRQLKYRRQMILGKGVVGNEDAHMSLLAMIGANDTKKEKGEDDSSSSSESDCNDFGKTVFIRSLDASGKVEEDEEEQPVTTKIQGPTLPNQEYRRILSLAKRSESPQPFEKKDEKKEKEKERGRREVDRSPRRRSSRDRSRDRYTSRGRSRSRERRRERSKSVQNGDTRKSNST
ncbi:hypothetical protein PENTCL1PPCAC_1139, partial [Pristionchus entomophagus]